MVSWTEIQNLALEEIADFLQADEMDKEDYLRVKIALGSLSAYTRIRATERVRDVTQLRVVEALARDKEQLEEYIVSTLPHLTPARLLKTGD